MKKVVGPKAIWLFCSALSLCAVSCDPVKRVHDEERPLVNAAGLSAPETLALLQAGADVNKRSYSHFGWTPLISAVYHRKPEVIDLLLSYNADPNIGDHDNKTALVWAIETWGQNTNLISKLLEHGADPTIRNRFGSDAFDAANSQPNARSLVELLQKSRRERRATPRSSGP